MRRSTVILVSIIWLALGGITDGMTQPSRLVYSPHWLPQAQFAGYYVALDQGFYEEAGLDVEIIHPTASDDPAAFLKDGRADIISHFLVSALIARSEGIDLVNVAQLSQHSGMLFVSRKSTEVQTLEDFEGKHVGVWLSGFGEIPRALLQEREIEVQWVPIFGTVNLFLAGGIDIMTVMWYNEYHQLYLSGIDHEEMNTFFLSDYGYNLPEDGLYTLGKTLESRSDEIERFVQATLKGWDYAAENVDYTLQLIVSLMRKQHIPSNMAHQRWMLEKVLELQEYESKSLARTELSLQDFQDTVRILGERGMLDDACDYTVFFQPVHLHSQENHQP
ncbi:ABC transporter substrate-binding protein [Balneolaceae bacterium ANBcel3]|nr:ABC transporter substrate-binding protein [Balneolaceae bacterium ANBcel3]